MGHLTTNFNFISNTPYRPFIMSSFIPKYINRGFRTGTVFTTVSFTVFVDGGGPFQFQTTGGAVRRKEHRGTSGGAEGVQDSDITPRRDTNEVPPIVHVFLLTRDGRESVAPRVPLGPWHVCPSSFPGTTSTEPQNKPVGSTFAIIRSCVLSLLTN